MKSYKKFNRSNALCISQFNLITDWTFVLFVAGSFDQIEFYLPSSDANQRNNTYSVDSYDDHTIRETGINIFDISTVYSNEQMESQSDDF